MDDDWDGAVDDWNDVDDSPVAGDCLNDDGYFFERCDFDDGLDDDWGDGYPLQGPLREPLPDLLPRKVSQLHPLCNEGSSWLIVMIMTEHQHHDAGIKSSNPLKEGSLYESFLEER